MLARTDDALIWAGAFSNANAWKFYKRLFSLAFKTFRCDRADAFDAASHGICAALEKGALDWPYCRAAVKNFILENRRNRKRRNEDYKWTYYDDDNEAIETKKAHVDPVQELHLIAKECVEAIHDLPGVTSAVMLLAAIGFEQDEIANKLDMTKSDVHWRVGSGRKILRRRDIYGLGRKRGHAEYIGIRKHHQKWVARITAAGHEFYLGSFDSAAEAVLWRKRHKPSGGWRRATLLRGAGTMTRPAVVHIAIPASPPAGVQPSDRPGHENEYPNGGDRDWCRSWRRG